MKQLELNVQKHYPRHFSFDFQIIFAGKTDVYLLELFSTDSFFWVKVFEIES